ncbi:gliding motility protein [Streptomyces sp. NPDC088116]|uniref:gliding motility protein n=1 Tax=Streptomyces sp. NPDC088116 TaxID=3365825 RepID=UPI0037FC9344
MADEAPGEAEATTEKTDTGEAGPVGSGSAEGEAEAEAADDGASEGVEIPKQQSADAAADNEAGKSTRK